MYEIWRHIPSGDRYLVAVHFGQANAAAGPLNPWEDPRVVLEGHTNQHHNVMALLNMRRAPEEYTRELTTDEHGHAVTVTNQPLS